MKYLKFKSITNFSKWLEYKEISELLDNLNRILNSNTTESCTDTSCQSQSNTQLVTETSSIDILNQNDNIINTISNTDNLNKYSELFDDNNKKINKSKKNKSKLKNKLRNANKTIKSYSTLSTQDIDSNVAPNNELLINQFNTN